MNSGSYQAKYIESQNMWFVVQLRMGGQPKTICKYKTEAAAMKHADRLNREARK